MIIEIRVSPILMQFIFSNTIYFLLGVLYIYIYMYNICTYTKEINIKH